MPVVKLFAQAREAAGTSTVDIPGATVGEVLDTLRARFGGPLSEVISVSNVWCNGEPTDPTSDVGATDELAILPPVSGG